jgi:hypothetical protein
MGLAKPFAYKLSKDAEFMQRIFRGEGLVRVPTREGDVRVDVETFKSKVKV